MSKEKTRPIWPALLVALATVAVFANGLLGGFVWVDHKEIVQQGFVIDSWGEFRSAWTGSITDLGRNLDGAEPSSGYFRPVQLLWVTLNVWLFGQNALLHHIPNIVLHIASALLLMAIVRRLSSDSTMALFCALLYAVHPIHTESVTWISGSKDTLAGVFFFGALALYVKWRHDATARWAVYSCSIGLFGLGLLTKEAVIVLPALLLLVELLGRGARGGSLFGRSIPIAGFGLVAFAYLAVRAVVLGTLGDMHEGVWHGEGPYETFLTMPGVLAEYAAKMLIPIGLTTADTTLIITDPLQLSFLAGIFLVLFGIGLIVHFRKRLPLVSFGLAWFFVALLPVLNILPLHHIKAERFVYLPSAGFCIALAAAWHRLDRGRAKRYAIGAAVLYLLLLGGLTIDRNRDWAGDLELFGRDVARTPNYREGRTWLGIAYLERGGRDNLERALEHLDAAARVDPAYTSFVNLLGLHHNRGLALLRLERYAEAVRALETAASVDPGEPRVFMNLGIALGYRGRLAESLAAYGRAEQLDPRLGIVFFNRALTLCLAGRPEDALADLEGALRLMPEHLGSWNLRGKILFDGRNPTGAARCFRRSLALEADQPAIVELLRLAEEAGRRERGVPP